MLFWLNLLLLRRDGWRNMRPAGECHHDNEQTRVEVCRHTGKDHAQSLRTQPDDSADYDRSNQPWTDIAILVERGTETQDQEDYDQGNIQGEFGVCCTGGECIEDRIDQNSIESALTGHAT